MPSILNLLSTRKELHGSKKQVHTRLPAMSIEVTPPPPPPAPACHGKAQNTNNEYIRIRPDILNTIKEKVKTEKPKKVYEDMDLIDGPRNFKQVKNAKYKANRKEQQTIGR